MIEKTSSIQTMTTFYASHLCINLDRAKMKDLVSLLGGRDFETREFKEEIAEDSFANYQWCSGFMNQYSFSNLFLAHQVGRIHCEQTHQFPDDAEFCLYSLSSP